MRIINGYKDEFKTLSTTKMELFRQGTTGYRGKFRILPNTQDGTFCKNSKKLKAVTIFAKTIILGFEYASELPSKCKLSMFHF